MKAEFNWLPYAWLAYMAILTVAVWVGVTAMALCAGVPEIIDAWYGCEDVP